MSDYLHNPFHDRPPEDIVPRGLTREALERLNDLTGTEVTYTEPGEVITDPDGLPIGVGPSRTTSATVAAPVITRAEADRLGITPEEFPNIHIQGEGH